MLYLTKAEDFKSIFDIGHLCPLGWLDCQNGRCVAPMFQCDLDDDCGNMQDEMDCPHDPKSLCELHQFECADSGRCIPARWRCDGHPDCTDVSDEVGCNENTTKCDGFQCTNHLCIPDKWVCDDQWDCEDGSDEVNCTIIAKASNRSVICTEHEFECEEDICIPVEKVCDHKKDCFGGQDEDKFCEVLACANMTCSQECYLTPLGAKCACFQGYKLASDGKSCLDVDECVMDPSPCPQRCINTKGNFTCSCFSGFSLDGNQCFAEGPEPLLLYATSHEIRGMWLRSERLFPIVRSDRSTIGVSYDGTQSRIYWVEQGAKGGSVNAVDLDGTNSAMVISKGLQQPEDVAVDWLGRNLYITDAGLKAIIACKIDGSMCTFVLTDKVDQPRAIVLDPKNGYMYWTDWGKYVGIFRAEMNGYGRFGIVTRDIGWPNGLTLDYVSKRVYWCDAQLKRIEHVDLDGTDRKVLLEDPVFHPYSLSVFEDTIYWSDWSQFSLDKCNKRTGHNQSLVVRASKKQIMGIHVYHPVMFSHERNPCWDATCSHICLVAQGGFSCACPQGYTLDDLEKTNCYQSRDAPFILAAEEHSIFHIHPESVGQNIVTEFPNQRFVSIGDMAFDWETLTLYVSDVSKHVIYAMNTTSFRTKTLISSRLDMVEGLDFDYVGRNLYWCDAGTGLVEAASADGTNRVTLVKELSRPMDLALSPDKGVMFIACAGTPASVGICDMDGSNCKKIVDTGLGIPVAIAVSPWNSRVFWGDAKLGRIESVLMRGGSRQKNLERKGKVMSVAVNEDYTFWTDMDTHTIHFSKNDKKSLVVGNINLPQEHNGSAVIKIGFFSRPPAKSPGACATKNGGCSQLCLSNPLGFVCACNDNQELGSDGKNCQDFGSESNHTCLTSEFTCGDGQCIQDTFRCDKRSDCADGTDEVNCTQECPPGDFQCTDGRCILANWRCDHMDDCGDNSDELNCTSDHVSCDSSEFECGKEGKCIPMLWRCDGDDDCGNRADELECGQITCGPREFMCKDGKCLPNAWKCDGEKDCKDGSDESTCVVTVQTCGPKEFTCKSGNCLDAKLVCDRRRDCEDGSDELGCEYEVQKCPRRHFECKDKMCIKDENVCDGFNDCSKGEDEENCKSSVSDCTAFEFHCKSGRCILRDWLCDGVNNCGDNEDETLHQCHYVTSSKQPPILSLPSCDDGFNCDSGECVAWSKVCDQVPDCMDNSDEGVRCGSSCSLDNGGCSHKCRDTPIGSICSCREGYILNDDGLTCEDLDECLTPGHCSQVCVNTKGGFKCTCVANFSLTADGKRCKADGGSAVLLLQTPDGIRSLGLEGQSQHLVKGTNTEMRGMDMDAIDNTVFWTEISNGVLNSVSEKGVFEVIALNLKSPSFLAFDWIARNLYFTTSELSIDVCKRDGSFCGQVLILNSTTSSLNLAPTEGLMFWSVFNEFTSWHSGIIERANMDGSRRSVIVSESLNWPSSITVDHIMKKLYWVDVRLNIIEVSDLDGFNRETIVRDGIQYPYSMALFEDQLYWSDWGTQKLVRCNKFTGGSRFSFHWDDVRAHVLKISHPAMQPNGFNSCDKAHCDHLCLLKPNGFTCKCAYKFVQGSNYTSCILKEEQPAFTDGLVSDKIICSKDYCFNGGVCTDDAKGLFCRCPQHFSGVRCQNQILNASAEKLDYSWVAGVVFGLFMVALVLVGIAFYCHKHTRARSLGESVSVSFKNPMFSLGRSGQANLDTSTTGVQEATETDPEKNKKLAAGELYRWPSAESVDSAFVSEAQQKDGKSLLGGAPISRQDKVRRFFERL